MGGVLPLTYLYTERGPNRCRLHGLKKGGMRRRAEARNTTHELMAFSGHKSLAEVRRYTDAADKKRLADSGAVKMAEAQAAAPKRLTDQSGLHKH